MITDKQEKAFKELIKETVYESSPDFVLSSVMQRLEKDKTLSTSQESPLIPRRVFVFLLTILFVFTGFSLYTIQDFYIPGLSNLFQLFQDFDVSFKWIPELSFGKMNTLIVMCTFPVVMIQFYFIKNYYEKSL